MFLSVRWPLTLKGKSKLTPLLVVYVRDGGTHAITGSQWSARQDSFPIRVLKRAFPWRERMQGLVDLSRRRQRHSPLKHCPTSAPPNRLEVQMQTVICHISSSCSVKDLCCISFSLSFPVISCMLIMMKRRRKKHLKSPMLDILFEYSTITPSAGVQHNYKQIMIVDKCDVSPVLPIVCIVALVS